MKKLQKGFTLIELLVVIAIIGILSSIVLASLSSARSKGEDAAILSTLSNMRVQGELLYSNLNTYGVSPATAGTCPGAVSNDIFGTSSTGSLFTLTTDLVKKAGASPANVYCHSDSSGWVASAKLKSTPTQYACADSSGASKIVTGATALSGAAGTGAASTTARICN